MVESKMGAFYGSDNKRYQRKNRVIAGHNF